MPLVNWLGSPNHFFVRVCYCLGSRFPDLLQNRYRFIRTKAYRPFQDLGVKGFGQAFGFGVQAWCRLYGVEFRALRLYRRYIVVI